MFFQGSLQEGISQAVQQARSVICFVTDGGAESTEWEETILTHADVKPLLESQAVLLRLEAGSESESFLAQLYPLPKKPTLVCIKGGELKEYIAGGTSTELILQRLQKALQPAEQVAQPVAHSSPQATSSSSQGSVPVPAPSTASPVASEDTSPGQATPSSTSSNNNNNNNPQQVQSLLVEQATRLEAQRKREAEATKRRREEKGKAKAEELAVNPSKKAETKDKHAEQFKKRKQAERDERARILKAIEDDKAARKARQADREAERRAALELEQGGSEMPSAPVSQLIPPSGRLSEHCSLQVRLFDGSTLRSRFSSRETVRTDVRQFVDENRTDGDAPYTFKVLLTPLPNKTIDVTEESKSLQELQLAPSATLILLPVQKYAGAYSGEGNIFQRLLAYILAFFSPLTIFFTTLFSVSGPPQVPDATEARTSDSEEREKRLRGLRDRGERRNDQQFYNGNSVSQTAHSWKTSVREWNISDQQKTNFEPNVDDDQN